ncbi:uncharacterized protein K452DRAFT_46322 [Aplosporella prunicola CBS 121167]|uniref:Uncharacterized protein n=1 Tax=Aplosporella prunicola CBS 121167 TaxID=1176127 RepID=A0A6A6AUF3_9PEZI|nr:uncharacterized protein K452DRAFT_46322 [Aplosporella prunicola CBS 121167]KAF2135226.1 hypothetical protein K452DRAFT_46322 [Aplosporella prunicola CBS 121167]
MVLGFLSAESALPRLLLRPQSFPQKSLLHPFVHTLSSTVNLFIFSVIIASYLVNIASLSAPTEWKQPVTPPERARVPKYS